MFLRLYFFIMDNRLFLSNTMKTKTTPIKVIVSTLISAAIALSLSACSEDKSNKTNLAARGNYFGHPHGEEVTNLEKHKFEHQFAEQCVEREIQDSINKDVDRKRFEKPCMCIATYMMKDLTATEAEKFLEERKNTQSLRIRFENAAYQCLQKNKQQQVKSPVIFNQR